MNTFKQVTTGKWNNFSFKTANTQPEADEPTPQPAPNTATTEQERARQWINNLNFEAMQENDNHQTELYKYEVTIYKATTGFYLFTKSPQQKAAGRRAYLSATARGDIATIKAGFERFLAQMEAKRERHTAKREAKREARASFVNPYKVGDFLYSSWGYDQTNREFYQVLEVGETSLKIREVAQNRESTGYDSWNASPRRNEFIKPAQWVTIQVHENGYHHVPSPVHGGLYAYEGKPVYASTGH